MDGVDGASLEATCCDSGNVILYVGIHETGQPSVEFHDYPADGIDMPEAVSQAYTRFLEQAREAGRAGGTEDLTQGHSLLSNPAAREAQMAFIPLAKEYGPQLHDILYKSSDEDHRAIAAYVLGYSADKKTVLMDLAHGMRDPDPTVRANAARAVAAIAVYAEQNPDAGILIDPPWFIELLNSPVWTDRNNAAVGLVTLTESRQPAILSQLRQQALSSVLEMARWKHLPHALPAYILLGRTAGIPEAELQSAWSKGERDRIIAKAAAASSKTK
jgi:tape measure domain-containing protein